MVSNLTYTYCCEDISLIENYDKAIKDESQTWLCHHRLETHDENNLLRNVALSSSDLIKMNLYYNRPAKELIFLTRSEHQKVHLSLQSNRDIISKKMSERIVSDETRSKQASYFWYTDGTIEIRAKECPDGFVRGKLPIPEESKKNFGKSLGKKWFNNGIKSTLAFECPEGYIPGRLKK